MSNKSQIKFLALIIVSVFALGAVSVCTDDAYATEGDPTDTELEIQALLDDLQSKFNEIDVAIAKIDENHNITVVFKTNDSEDIFIGAQGLFEALNKYTGSTLSIAGEEFTLGPDLDIKKLANAILGDGGIPEFLEYGELTSHYTAEVKHDGKTIPLGGNVSFKSLIAGTEGLLDDLQSKFNEIDVAIAKIDENHNITVVFKTNDSEDIFIGAQGLFEALNKYTGSTLSIAGEEFTLGPDLDIKKLANAILGDGGIPEFLEYGELTSHYTAEVKHDGKTIPLGGNVSFKSLIAGTEGLLDDLQSKFNEIDVAIAKIDENHNITVVFKTNDSEDIFIGAQGLFEALNKYTGSTLSIAGEEFTLGPDLDIKKLANAILGDGGIPEFLEYGELTSHYTAEVKHDGKTIPLGGNVSFKSLIAGTEGLLDDLQSKFNEIDVAIAKIDENHNITVVFKTNDSEDIFIGAQGLFEALNKYTGSTLSIAGEEFTLGPDLDIKKLANAILGDGGIPEFLEYGELTSHYTAEVKHDGKTIPLGGNVSFKSLIAGTEGLLDDLQSKFNEIDVAIAKIDENHNITVVFKTNDSEDIFIGAQGLFEALNKYTGSTLSIAGEEFTLGPDLDIKKLANAILGDGGIPEFLEYGELTSHYTAEVKHDGKTIPLGGNVSFKSLIAGTEGLLDDLQSKFNEIDVAIAKIDENHNITVVFKTNDSEDIFIGAQGLFEALNKYTGSTLSIAGEEFTLGPDLDIKKLANAILGDGGIPEFLEYGELTSHYTAEVKHDGKTIPLGGNVSFKSLIAGTEGLLDDLQSKFNEIDVAIAKIDENHNITVVFKTNDSEDIFIGAQGLFEALNKYTGSTLSIAGEEFTLGPDLDIKKLANAILGDGGIPEFLEYGELTSHYTAEVKHDGKTIPLGGNVSFKSLIAGTEGLLDDLQSKFNEIDVAIAKIDENHNITVVFKTNDSEDIFIGAQGLFEALNKYTGSTLSIAGEEFTLGPDLDIKKLANAILGDGGIPEFLEYGELTSHYTAEVKHDGKTIPLGGNVSFAMSYTITFGEGITVKDVKGNDITSGEYVTNNTELTVVAVEKGGHTSAISAIIGDDSETVDEIYIVKGEVTFSVKYTAELVNDNVTVTLPDSIYDNNVKMPTVTVKICDTILNPETDYTVSFSLGGDTVVEVKNVGTYTVTVTGKGNYTGSATGTFEITAKEVLVTPDGLSKVYDGTDPVLTYNLSETIDVTGTLSRVAGEDVGAYDITMGSMEPVSANYVLSMVDPAVKFTITVKTITVTPDGLSKVYDGTDPVLTYNLSETIDVTGTLSRVAGEDVGAYDITMGSMEPVSANYVLSMVDPAVKFTITVKTITVTPDGLSKVYDGTDPVLTYNLSETIDVTGTLSRVAGEDVGAYDITMGSMEPVSANYVLSMVDPAVKFTITVKTITVTPDGLSKVYDGTDPVLTYNLSETIDVTGTLSRVAGEDVGAYDITMGSMEPVSANYVLSMVDPAVKFTITVKTITVTPDGLSKVYDGTDPVLTYNLSETIDVTGTLSRVAGEDVGAYDITMGSMEPVSANYVLSMVDPAVKFTIKSVDEYLGGLIDKEDSPTVKISKDAAKDLTNVDFEKLTGKTLVIDVVEDGVTLYSWTFEGTYEESNTGTFNASILKVAEPDEALTNLLESKNVKNPLVLNFSAKGKLPMDPTIKYYVGGDFEEGAILTLFFYNEEGNGLDRIASDLIVDENGYVEFSPPHFSQYVLAEMDSESGGAGSNTLLYVGVGIIVAIIAFIAVVALRRP